MIEFFTNTREANAFLSTHPEWKPVSVSAGHISGSVLVLFEAVVQLDPPGWSDASGITMPEPEWAKIGNQISIKLPARFEPQQVSQDAATNAAPPRRGRPPKVKDAK